VSVGVTVKAFIKIKSCKSEDFSPNVFFHEEKEYEDPVEIGSVFNTFFTSLSSTSLSSEFECNKYVDQTFTRLKREKKICIKDSELEKFKFVHTNANIVEKLILNLNATSGAGFSGIPSKVIKYSYSILAPILASLFNHCIDVGKFPVEWKSAIVTPLYKNKGVKSDFNNYRGISVLPPIAKLFEKILASQITIYLNLNNILFSGQHGFRNGHSCETALHELISYLNENRNKRAISLLLFIDFRKAFDLVDTNILLRKLFHYGFSNSAIELIANYFKDRFQSVKYDKKMSPLLSITLGVPQGSVLGPLFFLIMINDLAYIIDLMCKLFADDTTLGDVDKDLITLINRFVEKLKVFLEWCDFNKLDINWSKTYFMFVTNKRVKLPKEIVVGSKAVNDKCEEIKVSVVNSFKLLGVTIDNKLTFVEHCSNLKKIVNKKLYSIKRLFFLCTSVKIHFFKTFILPYFDYCLSLIIYFPSSAYQSLNNCFNICLYKLFKFRPEINRDEDEDEEKIMKDFIEKLHSYNLFTLQSRIYNKLLMFANSIKTNGRAPVDLRSQINLPAPEDDLEKQVEQTVNVYNLRRGRTLVKNIIPETKYETLTFKHFFPRLLSFYKHLDFSVRKDSFRLQINLNFNENLKIFLDKFPKFDIKYTAFYRKKKKKMEKSNGKKIK
jgi:hypothetical protein